MRRPATTMACLMAAITAVGVGAESVNALGVQRDGLDRSARSSAANWSGSTAPPTTTVVARIKLRPPLGHHGRARGTAQILKTGSMLGVVITARELVANSRANAYAVWLYNSRLRCRLLGFVYPGVSKSGRMSTAGPLLHDARRFHHLVVSLETIAHPTRPHHVVLIGKLTT
jgi:hypothetical protein